MHFLLYYLVHVLKRVISTIILMMLTFISSKVCVLVTLCYVGYWPESASGRLLTPIQKAPS